MNNLYNVEVFESTSGFFTFYLGFKGRTKKEIHKNKFTVLCELSDLLYVESMLHHKVKIEKMGCHILEVSPKDAVTLRLYL